MMTNLPGVLTQHMAQNHTPRWRYDGKEDFAAWQKKCREKLWDLLGMDKFVQVDPDYRVEWERETDDYREIRFTYATEANFRAVAHILIPKEGEAPFVPVICLQGHSKGMHISLGRPKFEGDEKTIKGGDRDFAIRAVKEGCAAIALEQRYMGEAGGDETGPKCDKSLWALLYGRTAIGERVWDIMHLIDVLNAQFDCLNMDKLICLGNSGGGTATFYAACIDQRIRYAVPSCSVCTYKHSIVETVHCVCNYVPHVADYFDMGDLGGLIAPRGLVVVNGKDDPIFPKPGVDETLDVMKPLFEAAGASDMLRHVEGQASHRFYADPTWPVIHELLEKE